MERTGGCAAGEQLRGGGHSDRNTGVPSEQQETLFHCAGGRALHRLPRELEESPSFEILKTQLDVALLISDFHFTSANGWSDFRKNVYLKS